MTWFTTERLDNGIARLMLHRKPVNALNPAFLDALSAEYDSLASDEAIRAVVLGSTLKVLSAGLDLKEAQAFDLEDQKEIVRGLNQSFCKLYALPKPTIAAVNGAAIAGGFFFVLGCDYRVASRNASIGLAEVRVGATLPVGPSLIAMAELSAADARRLVLGGQPMVAKDAQVAGILDEVVEPDAMMDRAMAAAHRYALLPPQTYAAAKAQLRGPTVQAIETAMKITDEQPQSSWFTEETKVAMAAMLAG